MNTHGTTLMGGRRPRSARETAAILITTLVVVMVVAGVSVAYLTVVVYDTEETRKDINDILAYEAAEAAVSRAMNDFIDGGAGRVGTENWDRSADDDQLDDGWPSFGETDVVPVQMDVGKGIGDGSDLTAFYFGHSQYVGINDLGEEIFAIRGYGAVDREIAGDDTSFQHIVVIEQRVIFKRDTDAYFKWAAFGDEFVEAGHGDTTSYVSSDGLVPDKLNPPSTIPGYEGDIGTNGTASTSIDLDNNSAIHGSIYTGAGTPYTNVVDPTEEDNVTLGAGEDEDPAQALDEPVDLPNKEAPPYAEELGVVNGDLTLPAGVYVADSINLSGGDRLVATGETKIYVRGSITVGSGSEVYTHEDVDTPSDPNAGKPIDMQIIGEETCTSVTINGNMNWYAILYAPEADVVWNGAPGPGSYRIAGSFIANSHDSQSNAMNIYWDEDLDGLGVFGDVILEAQGLGWWLREYGDR